MSDAAVGPPPPNGGFDAWNRSGRTHGDVRTGDPAAITTKERREIAVGAGQWVARALRGEDRRGASGRKRLIEASHVFVIFADLRGTKIRPPFATYKKEDITQFCCAANSLRATGLSIFIGWPSVFEAKICVEAAGLPWVAPVHP